MCKVKEQTYSAELFLLHNLISYGKKTEKTSTQLQQY